MLRQISERRSHANDAKEFERAFYAAVHGAKYEPRLNKVSEAAESSLTKEEQEKVNAHLEKRMKEKQREMQSNG